MRVFVAGASGAIGRQLVMALDMAGGQISGISSLVNPDKLTHLGRVADVSSLLGSAR